MHCSLRAAASDSRLQTPEECGLFSLQVEMLQQLIAHPCAFRPRERDGPRGYWHHLKGDAPLRSIHRVYADDIELVGNRRRIGEDVQHNEPFNKRRGAGVLEE